MPWGIATGTFFRTSAHAFARYRVFLSATVSAVCERDPSVPESCGLRRSEVVEAVLHRAGSLSSQPPSEANSQFSGCLSTEPPLPKHPVVTCVKERCGPQVRRSQHHSVLKVWSQAVTLCKDEVPPRPRPWWEQAQASEARTHTALSIPHGFLPAPWLALSSGGLVSVKNK